MLFTGAPWWGLLEWCWFGTPFFSLVGGNMTTETLQRRLRCLGWKACELGPQGDGQWGLWVTSCRHTIYSTGNTRHDAWSAACSMAMKLTLNSVRPGPHPCPSLAQASRSGGGRLFTPGGQP